MKVTFETNEVLPKLMQAASVINSKNSISVLSDVCFTISEDNIIMTASDGENWVTERADVVISDMDASICVAAKDIINCLKTLSDENVTMTIDKDASTVTLDYGSGKINLPYDASDDFPTPNLSVDGASEIIVYSNLIKTAISLARASTENSIVRPIMSGVHFLFSDGTMTVNGASHARVVKFVEHVKADSDMSYFEFTLPPKAYSVITSVLEGVSEDVKLKFTDKAVSVSNRNFRITARLLEGAYPDCNLVIPQNSPIKIEVDKECMFQALRRVLSIDNSNRLFTLYVNRDTITVSAEDISFGRTSEEEMRCVNPTDSELQICFNGDVVSDVLRSIDDEEVVIEMSAPTLPAVFHAKDEVKSEKYMSVVMPMQIQAPIVR
jgi:DNA polymerase-3 subunit beta